MKIKHLTIQLISLCLSVCLLSGCAATGSTASAIPNIGDTIKMPQDDIPPHNAESVSTSYLEGGLSVHFIDVGQGDSALVICDGKTMLIDGGRPSASSIIYTYLKKIGVNRLDYIIASHADDDHVGGLSAPLSKMKVGNVLAPKTEANTQSYESFKAKAAVQGLTVRHPSPGDMLILGSSKTAFLGPITESADDRNNGSIVMKVIYGDTSFLFTGDAERKEEQQIIDSGSDLSATVLKVGHHGSENSTTYPFLREVMPQYAVISSGKGNTYGHPTDKTLSRLRDAGVKVFRTDMQGDIIAISDGKTVTITATRNINAVTNPTDSEKSYYKSELTQDSVYQNENNDFYAEAPANQNNNAAESSEVHDYIGNVKSKKFHHVECAAAQKILEQNKVLLHCSRSAAISDGYMPCGQCKP